MPHIDNDIKLDFKDVLIRPKRSTLKSRADVDLTRQYVFRNSKKTYEGIPIVASNMDTVGTFEMAIQLSKLNLFTTIHKHYTVEQWKQFAAENPNVLSVCSTFLALIFFFESELFSLSFIYVERRHLNWNDGKRFQKIKVQLENVLEEIEFLNISLF